MPSTEDPKPVLVCKKVEGTSVIRHLDARHPQPWLTEVLPLHALDLPRDRRLRVARLKLRAECGGDSDTLRGRCREGFRGIHDTLDSFMSR